MLFQPFSERSLQRMVYNEVGQVVSFAPMNDDMFRPAFELFWGPSRSHGGKYALAMPTVREGTVLGDHPILTCLVSSIFGVNIRQTNEDLTQALTQA